MPEAVRSWVRLATGPTIGLPGGAVVRYNFPPGARPAELRADRQGSCLYDHPPSWRERCGSREQGREIFASAGVLLHPTSLPGPYGIGDLGPAAYAWVDALARAGQTWWQILPLGPTGYGDSPTSRSPPFAGNPYLLSPEAADARRAAPAERPGRRCSSPPTGSITAGVIDVQARLLRAGLGELPAGGGAGAARRRSTPSARSKPPGWTTTPCSWP